MEQNKEIEIDSTSPTNVQNNNQIIAQLQFLSSVPEDSNSLSSVHLQSSFIQDLPIPINYFQEDSSRQIQSYLQTPQNQKYQIKNVQLFKLPSIFLIKKKFTEKNTNIPKFLIKIIRKYKQEYQDLYKYQQQGWKILDNVLKILQTKLINNREININLNHLGILFEDVQTRIKRYQENIDQQQVNQQHKPMKQKSIPKIQKQNLKQHFGQYKFQQMNPKINRILMIKIIRRQLVDQVLYNSQIKNKLLYLNACKVFALRCLSSELTTRVQSKKN